MLSRKGLEERFTKPVLYSATFFVLSLIFLGLVVGVIYTSVNGFVINTPRGGNLQTEHVKTKEDLQKGLSGYSGLGDNQAMLFEFENSELHGIWMKDMNFSIDIVWLDDSKKVVSVKENVSPESYPKVFYPETKAKYVIETKAGQTKEHGLEVGSQLNW